MTKRLVDVFGLEAFREVCGVLDERDSLLETVEALGDELSELERENTELLDMVGELRKEAEFYRRRCEELELLFDLVSNRTKK